MSFLVVSFSYKHTPQEIREKLSFQNDEQKERFLASISGFDFVDEIFVVNTCNRVECVAFGSDENAFEHAVLGNFARQSGVDFYKLKECARAYSGKEAVSHLFRVSASLESLVIGESQITGQVKEGFAFAYERGYAKLKLQQLLGAATKCAAAVRNATDISSKPISIASVAVAQAVELLGDQIMGMRAVVVGAGEMGKLAAKNLIRSGVDVVLVGRNKASLEQTANMLGEECSIATIDKLPALLNRYRLLFCATSSKEPVVNAKMITNTNLDRVWFDMAIPKDIEVGSLEGLRLFRIDDLERISSSNHALRQEQALKAHEVIEEMLEEFFDNGSSVKLANRALKGLYGFAEDAIVCELERAIKKGFIDTQSKTNSHKLIEQSIKKVLYPLTKAIKQDEQIAKIIKKLYTNQGEA